jgi:hypothetical protein
MNKEQSQKIKAIDDLIEEKWGQAIHHFMWDEDFTPPYNPRFADIIDRSSKKAEKKSQIYLQPWISIIEVAIQWLSSVHILIDEARSIEDSSELLTPWVLTGVACSQAVAIRKLCMCGLDNSAKIILRSLIETLNICTVTLYDPTLREQYKEAQDFEDAKRIWGKRLRNAQMVTVIKEIMKKMNITDEEQALYLDYQEEEKQLLHQTVHTSYVAAAFASSVQSSDLSTFPSAILGSSTIFSIRTLACASKSIWFFSLIGSRLLYEPLDSSRPLLKLNSNVDWTKITATSFYVFNEMIIRYWDEDRIEAA